MKKVMIRFTVAVIAILCVYPALLAETRDYVIVQLDIIGTRKMSGAQSVHVSQWSRFDLSFGREWARINTSHETAPNIPPVPDDDLPGKPELLASVVVQSFEPTAGGYKVMITIHTGTPAFAGLIRGGDWVYATEIDTAFITPDRAYEFYLQEPISKNRYKAAIQIKLPDESSLPQYPASVQAPGAADFEFSYRINQGENNEHGTAVNLQDTLAGATSDRCEVTFENVLHGDHGDSCYHYVTVEVEDIEFTDVRRLSGMLLIERMTVFGSNAPIDAGTFTADRMIVDRFKKYIHLANGRPVEILIPPEENQNLPFRATEALRITGTW